MADPPSADTSDSISSLKLNLLVGFFLFTVLFYIFLIFYIYIPSEFSSFTLDVDLLHAHGIMSCLKLP